MRPELDNKKFLKETIREYAFSLGLDDVGFAAISDYNSPRTTK